MEDRPETAYEKRVRRMEAYYTSLANKAHTLLLGYWALCKAWSLSLSRLQCRAWLAVCVTTWQ